MSKLSVVLAVYNEENNLEDCLNSVKDIASEIIIVDGGSKDQTLEIAKKFGAKIIQTANPPIFHINKQKALEAATKDWILQLDADERVTESLRNEIEKVLEMDNEEIASYENTLKKREIFRKHVVLLEKRDGSIGKETGEYCAFFIPRLNFFLGNFLRYGGVYPDGVIRLVKKGKAYFPCKSVHEQIVVNGKVGWLENDLLHMADPTFKRYLERNSRYINLIKDELRRDHVKKNFLEGINYFLIKPVAWLFMALIRHKGILDGIPGIIFSFFSALRFPRAYYRYLRQ